MAKKIFSYKGKSLEEPQTMDMKELVVLLPSRQRRSLKRGFTDAQKRFFHRVNTEKTVAIKTQCRDMIVLPNMVGRNIKIYSGKEFVSVEIMPEMIGHYLGEFSMTRKKVSHSAPGIGATRSSSSVSVR